MQPKTKKLIPIIFALMLMVTAILLMIPAIGSVFFAYLGITAEKPAYNDFDPFIPYVPGYFPDNFEITYVGHDESRSSDLDMYTEIYASDTHFFKTIQQKGKAVPASIPGTESSVHGTPAKIEEVFPLDWLEDAEKASKALDTSQGWMVTFILKNIYIQVVTNLPQEEAILLAEGLVPAICTSKPTATPW